MMTLGIFESKLLNKDIAKEVIAYLPKFEVLHCNKIVSHLINVCKYPNTKALYELKMFKMMVITYGGENSRNYNLCLE